MRIQPITAMTSTLAFLAAACGSPGPTNDSGAAASALSSVDDADSGTGQCLLVTPVGSPECDECLQNACCTEVNACLGNPDFISWLRCGFNCDDFAASDSCHDRCDALYPGQGAALSTMTACRIAHCPSQCDPNTK